jgi:YcaO cyclodehydratase, ATP-ad Mg2+-binding
LNRASISSECAASGLGYIVANAGTKIYDCRGGEILIVGSGCAKSADKARISAKYELLERIYSHDSSIRRRYATESIALTSWPNRNLKGAFSRFISPDDLLAHKADTCGTGAGLTLSEAITHACFELCERNLLGRWWYHHEFSLHELEVAEVSDHITRTILVPNFATNVPFAVACLHDISRGFRTFGSSLRLSFKDAKEHSFAEAVMIHHSLLRVKVPTYSDPKKVARYACMLDYLRTLDTKLGGRIAIGGPKHETIENTDGYDIFKSVTQLPEILIALLNTEGGVFVVRTYAPNVSTIASLRRESDTSRSVTDPFL